MVVNDDEIRRIYRLEKNTTRIVPIEEDFYNQLNEFVTAEKKAYLAALTDLNASNENKEFSTLKKMVQEWCGLRQKKILNLTLIAVRTGDHQLDGLAIPEKELFNSLVQELSAHQELLEGLFVANGSGTHRSKNNSTKSELSNIDVKIVNDVPSFMGFDSKEYGPFENGSVVELPYKVAKLLIGKKLAELE